MPCEKAFQESVIFVVGPEGDIGHRQKFGRDTDLGIRGLLPNLDRGVGKNLCVLGPRRERNGLDKTPLLVVTPVAVVDGHWVVIERIVPDADVSVDAVEDARLPENLIHVVAHLFTSAGLTWACGAESAARDAFA